jgi:hypothetical protein
MPHRFQNLSRKNYKNFCPALKRPHEHLSKTYLYNLLVRLLNIYKKKKKLLLIHKIIGKIKK